MTAEISESEMALESGPIVPALPGKMTAKINESEMAAFWKSGFLRGRELSDTDGNLLQVLYPGLAAQGGGPDFCGAAIAWRTGTRERFCQGDVELHTDSTLWRQHGHQNDPRFNTVILHVVLTHDPGTETVLENGCRVPVLPLQPYLGTARRGQGIVPPCRVSSAAEMVRAQWVLRGMGEERFHDRASGMKNDIGAMGAGQALYYWTMDALGYSRNRTPFRELAQRVPLHILEGQISPARRESLLFGYAGLLPSQRPPQPRHHLAVDPWAAELEDHWRRQGSAGRMDFSQWEFLCTRPANTPVRRIAAVAALAGKWPKGLFEGLLCETARPEGRIAQALCIAGEGYWAGHYDFGRSLGNTGPDAALAALLGQSRAMDIAVNVLLPFTFAWSALQRDKALRSLSLEFYRSHPVLCRNRVTRYVAGQIWSGPPPQGLSACHQQGMVHLFHRYCSLGACSECPMNWTSER